MGRAPVVVHGGGSPGRSSIALPDDPQPLGPGVPVGGAVCRGDTLEPEAIEKMVTRGVLKRDVHYFQPFGRRTQLIFKWNAIVTLIEGDQTKTATGTASMLRRRSRSMSRRRRQGSVGCSIGERSDGSLRLRFRWQGKARSVATGLQDTPENRHAIAALAELVGKCIKVGKDPLPIIADSLRSRRPVPRPFPYVGLTVRAYYDDGSAPDAAPGS